MNRRTLAAIVAGVLALAGAGLLAIYVRGADARAMANQQPTNVLVVARQVPRGTPVELAKASLEVRQLPAVAVVPGALADSTPLEAGRVAATDLLPGEQVLAGRFVDPSSPQVNDQVTVPPDLQQISIYLEPQRVIGARLAAGDTVGVVVSVKIKEPDQAEPIATTNMILKKVLVTRVQGVAVDQAPGTQPSTGAPSTSAGGAARGLTTAVMVTLAVNGRDAERIVFAQEFGKVYLTLQREGTKTGGTEIITVGNVFR